MSFAASMRRALARLVPGHTDLERQLAERTRERDEALEYQAATSDVLKLIGRSTFDLPVVLETLAKTAAQLCQADLAFILRREGDVYRGAALFGASGEAAADLQTYQAFLERNPLAPNRDSVTGRVALEGRIVHIADVVADPEYKLIEAMTLGRIRTQLGVPLLREGSPIGVMILSRQVVKPFTDRQIALVTTFADQAVIAIENARLLTELRTRTAALAESLEHQTASADILKAIASAPGEAERVLQDIAETAHRLFGAWGYVMTVENHRIVHVASGGPGAAEAAGRLPGEYVDRGSLTGRTVLEKRLLHLPDLLDHRAEFPKASFDHSRSVAVAPMLRGGDAIGVVLIARDEVRPFTEKQLQLLQSFADQAVIAIDNTRLLTELRESLERQTATAEVLRVISSSPGELGPVFEAMLENAIRICDAAQGSLWRVAGDALQLNATRGVAPELLAVQSRELHPAPGSVPYQMLETGSTVHVDDVASLADAHSRERLELGGARTALWVPMLKDRQLLGAFSLHRREVRPFDQKQIELVENFASQAVIAIENTRLLTELRQRTDDLQESLDYQTAVSDVLKVISRSTVDLDAVLHTVVTSAVRLCHADTAVIYRNLDGEYQWSAGVAVLPDYEERERRARIRPGNGTLVGRAALSGHTVQIADAWSDPLYEAKDDARVGHVRAMLGVPLLREGTVIGVIGLARRAVEPYSEREVQLVTTFADQAVIAIENARLFAELRQRTDDLARSVEELKALGEVTQAVNSTLDLQTVLTTIVAKAVEISTTDAGAIYVMDETHAAFDLRATYGMDEPTIAAIREQRFGIGDASIIEATARRAPAQIADLAAIPRNRFTDIVVRAGFRAILVIPLLRVDSIVGLLVVRRRAPGAFSAATVELLQTFAAQSVIAIQNARLFTEIEEKSRELAVASQHKSQFLANMSHELRTPLNAILGYTELILDEIYGATQPKMREVLQRVETNGRHLLGLINDVLDLSKIEAGQLTLALAEYSIKEMVQGVYVAVEPLATNKHLTLALDVPRDLPRARGDERRLAQVLLNLVGNAIKFTDQGSVMIRAAAENGSFTIAVRDTGPGIAREDQQKIFEEFQQADNSITRAKGGTGLGLAISRRIIEMHGGRIWVESEPGKGSTFSFTVPVSVERPVETV
jgi:signal transduction histidine kinase/dihydroneopterin aldolase